MSEYDSLRTGRRDYLFNFGQVDAAQKGMDTVEEGGLKRGPVRSPVKSPPDPWSMSCNEQITHRNSASQPKRQHLQHIQAYCSIFGGSIKVPLHKVFSCGPVSCTFRGIEKGYRSQILSSPLKRSPSVTLGGSDLSLSCLMAASTVSRICSSL